MPNSSQTMGASWANAYKNFEHLDTTLKMPSETLVRLFKGDYVTGECTANYNDMNCLDIGFGSGNNTAFLASLGLNVSGVEIEQSICDTATTQLAARGLTADLKVGTNQHLPFDSNSFDYLVSWNVLHYEGSEKNIQLALQEYQRVLKPNGRLFMSSTGPTHKILQDAQVLGKHLYQIGRKDDFRKGQVHFFFDDTRYIDFYLKPYFSELQIGRILDHLFTETLDWWIITGVKP